MHAGPNERSQRRKAGRPKSLTEMEPRIGSGAGALPEAGMDTVTDTEMEARIVAGMGIVRDAREEALTEAEAEAGR